MRNFDEELKRLGVNCLYVGGKLEKKMPEEGAVFEIDDSMCMCYISLKIQLGKKLMRCKTGRLMPGLRA